MTYNELVSEISRMIVECSDEYPENAPQTLREKAQWLMDSNDPPRGGDADLCGRIIYSGDDGSLIE